MRLCVLGAGSVGPAAAVLAASRGHDVSLWSPSGAGTAGLVDSIEAEGALEGRFPLRVAQGLGDAFSDADVALLAVPAYAFPALLPRIAAALPARLPLLIAPAAALSPLALDAMLAARGAPAGRAAIGAMGTTPVTARRPSPGRVRVAAIRAAVDMAAVPAASAGEMGALATALFGHASPPVPHALQAGLANANPIIHAVLALTNVTRIERGEAWPQYALMTPAACRMMEALAVERETLAAAFGVAALGLEESLHRANGVPLGPLAEMAAAIAASRGSVLGPASMETRYVTEDVPYGLAFYLWLARGQAITMPATEAVVTALEVLWGSGLRDNPLLEGLDPATLQGALIRGYGREG
ncbi:NAD/NADP-dependent octopine/nopaline dehydrogenase family protein [Pararoseomonas indoligenes]|uniref:NAD/NADP octopine/nopaline dehydrogenase family protein n=1 Tax=Roseomonas indoligenes TaxID=2820811 RepID=A0A940MW78_9PROT|nr:NAD/NADP-dependent octopine/nopaline dehydrogenase family protein [Pararoseomonas indoligenes]MBP0491934.1 NAD/NADP octopine/nopaline dehydrogenase family protein [Pararoseomonas indoligenes]